MTGVQVDEFLQTDDTYTLEAVEGELQSLYQNFLRFKDEKLWRCSVWCSLTQHLAGQQRQSHKRAQSGGQTARLGCG